MKFNEAWLREMVNPPASTAELCDRLTMSGLELESSAPVAPRFSGVVVAAISDFKPHPDADRLRICRADIGGGKSLQIVTGASNVIDGMRVPLAQIGAMLPGDKHITRSMLRGVESEGMLCSTVELGMTETADGVMILPADAPLGADIRDYLQLDDTVIELNVTPNRGDCLSVLGIAREIGAEFGVDVCVPRVEPAPAMIAARIPIEISSPQDCARYIGRVIRGVNARSATPLWMQERLRRCGLRSISAIVDITNYVMLELGQPLHAFNLNAIDAGIKVRRAQANEKLKLLDGQTIELNTDTLVIADHKRALAMAGIMGGAESAVDDATVDILLESAYFKPTSIAGRGRQHKLQTDSSQRFERGVDSEGQERAIERASRLVLDICGGESGPVCEVSAGEDLPRQQAIALRRDRLQRVLGFAPEDQIVHRCLLRLGMQVSAVPGGWSVTPPSSRPDISIEVDLIEEVVRIVGFDQVPMSRPDGRITLVPVAEGGVPRIARLRNVLVQRGYQEAITYSFVDAAQDGRLGAAAHAIPLANPISADMAVMRTSIWTGLIKAAMHNLSRQQSQVRLFEIGSSFEKKGDQILQINKMAYIVIGNSRPEQWAVKAREIDFFDVKGDAEAFLAALMPGGVCEFAPAAGDVFHPGQACAVKVGASEIARFGTLHPELTRFFGIRQQLFLGEIEIDELPAEQWPHHQPLSKFPSVRRDLSVSLDREIPAAKVLQTVREAAPAYLHDLQLFDVYEGEGIDSGKKSLALGLIFQGVSSTLRDEEIEIQVAAIVSHLAKRLGAVLRDS